MVKKKFQIGTALADGLQETVNAAKNYSGSLHVEVIPIKRVVLDPDNPRDLSIEITDLPHGPTKDDPLYEQKIVDYQNLTSIASSIKREGLLNPIIVYKTSDKYTLVAGERRTLASIIAGKEDIQAKILDSKPSEFRLSMLQWFENIERADLSLWERLGNLQKIISNHQIMIKKKTTPKDLSDLIGCSLQQASLYCTVLEADPLLKDAIKNNQIKNLDKAAFIAKQTSTTIRKKTIEKCINGATLTELKRFVELEQESNIERKKIDIKQKGRPSVKVNLGSTKNLAVVKCIVNAVLKVKEHENLHSLFKGIDWNDYASITKAFQNMLNAIEKKELVKE